MAYYSLFIRFIPYLWPIYSLLRLSSRGTQTQIAPLQTGIWHLPHRGVAIFRDAPQSAPAFCSRLQEELQQFLDEILLLIYNHI